MARNLVLCFDGTNNQYAATNTNVVKLYAMLDRNQSNQLAYYQPGIGTIPPPGVWDKAKKWLITKLDLAVAWLLEDHVSDGYRYLMRYYQPGDRIFIFGFSRGAYTARAVAAMVYKVGLLTQGNEELLPFAWSMFKREKNPEIYDGFRHTFSRNVPIYFLGLWDTVCSVGWMWDPQSLQYSANNPGVQIVRHAIALDERRAYFPTNLWGHAPDMPTDVEQVWFPGVHCDVGGGYPEAEGGLSKIALKWMMEKAEAAGLRFNPPSQAVVLPTQDTPKYVAPNPAALQHESLRGWWWLAEYIPKSFKDPTAGFAKRWMIHAGRHRHVPSDAKIHKSVFERMDRVPAYRPTNLPIKFEQVGNAAELTTSLAGAAPQLS